MSGTNLLALTTMAPRILYSGQLGTSGATLFQPSSTQSGIIKHGVLTNVGAAATTVTLELIPTGQSAGSGYIILDAYVLASGDSLSLADYLGGCFLGPSDQLYGVAGAASSINLVISGVLNS